jgi:hypothetical protein
MTSDEKPSEQLAYKAIGLAIGTIAHGAYLAYRYFRHGRVNPINIGVLAVLAAATIVAIVIVFLLRRDESRQPNDRWYRSRDHEQ